MEPCFRHVLLYPDRKFAGDLIQNLRISSGLGLKSWFVSHTKQCLINRNFLLIFIFTIYFFLNNNTWIVSNAN